MSQTDVANLLGLTFQQVGNYEKGTNRCAPSKLTVIARATDKPIEWFFGESGKVDVAMSATDKLGMTPQGIRLAEAFLEIEDNGCRDAIVRVTQKMAEFTK
jgi:transcriptional regulator with XRE-family HTH domain